MMRRLTPWLTLLLAILCAAPGFAQIAADSIRRDTLRNKFVPTGVRVGADLLALAKTQFQNNYKGWEFQGDIDFSRYYVVLEYGHWARDLHSDSAEYTNSGNYWRAGVDVNFLTKDPDRNVFFLGARYGRSVFTESMDVARYDPIWGLMSDTFYHAGINASWIELTTGLKVKIWKIFWLGYTGRLKFGLSTKGSEQMLPYDVPGFGRTDKETTWGFNYYFMIRLPVRKAPPVPASK
jgi:hypothetical protein